MSKEDQQIIVVKSNTLFEEDYFEGFVQAGKVDYENRILSNIEVMRRGYAEINPNFKQPIGYTIVLNPTTKKVFAYQRSSKDKEYGEKRLQGKWSWGFGGHIEPLDTGNGNPIRKSMLREIKEEIKIIGSVEEPKVIGYINHDSDDVGKVHFGILYTVFTDAQKVASRDNEISKIVPSSLSDLENMCSSSEFDVEDWSQIAVEPLRKLL